MRKCLAVALSVFLLLGVLPAGAQELVFADLRALAPEGTFLAAGATPAITPLSYKSEHISIEITSTRVEEADLFIADIYVASAQHFRRGLSHAKWGKQAQRIGTIATENGAILAMTGDYSHLFSKGLVVVNGDVIRKTDNAIRDNALIYPDGSMLTYRHGETTASEMLAQPLWQTFLFGPSLLQADGSPFDEFNSKVGVANPRSVIGYYSPGHFCFVLVDGRQASSRGLALVPLSAFMADLGCRAAYNLDGGQSAMLWFLGEVVNNPYRGGRALTDIVYIGE